MIVALVATQDSVGKTELFKEANLNQTLPKPAGYKLPNYYLLFPLPEQYLHWYGHKNKTNDTAN